MKGRTNVGGGKPEEEKTVTAGTSVKIVTPSDGKTIKKVTINPTPSQSKTVTPSTSQQTVSPDSGKLLSQVIVKAMEDVTPEVTAQTPIITQIAENLGVTITPPSGTNKQILQGNNANLLDIKNNAKKEGAYVWKKLTAEGGTFVDYVIDNNESKYPDGGTQDGYWYEKVVEGVDLLGLFGLTKMAVDTFTFSTRTEFPNKALSHSLGEVPQVALIGSGQRNIQQMSVLGVTIFSENSDGKSAFAMQYFYDASKNRTSYNSTNISSTEVKITYNNFTYFEAGVEYTLITMA